MLSVPTETFCEFCKFVLFFIIILKYHGQVVSIKKNPNDANRVPERPYRKRRFVYTFVILL